MTRPVARTIEDLQRSSGSGGVRFEFPPDNEGVIDITGVSGGMVLGLPRNSLSPESFERARNVRIQEGRVVRRPGTVEMELDQPDELPVMKVMSYLDPSGNNFLLRITREGVYVYRKNGWQLLSGNPFALEDRIVSTQIYGHIFMANGGRVRMLDLTKGTVERLDSPRMHFITSFGDRIVGARRGGSTIWWSGNLQPRDWEGETAGEETLVQNTSDVADAITGVFGLGREMIILRRRSVWVAGRQAQATAPFFFTPMLDDIGCDMPYSAVRTHGGLVFANYRTKAVYFLQPNAQPQTLSGTVESEIFDGITNLNWVEGAYDPFKGEYLLGIPRGEDGRWITRIWRLSFKAGAWAYDDVPGLASLGEVSTPSPLTMIDDLEGMIDDLEGTIAELGGIPGVGGSLVFYGGREGEVIQESNLAEENWDGSPVEAELLTHDLGSPSKIRSFMDVVFRVSATRDGEVEVALLNGDREEVRMKGFGEGTEIIRFPKPRIQGLKLQVRLRCSEGDFGLSTYSIRLKEKGMAR